MAHPNEQLKEHLGCPEVPGAADPPFPWLVYPVCSMEEKLCKPAIPGGGKWVWPPQAVPDPPHGVWLQRPETFN